MADLTSYLVGIVPSDNLATPTVATLTVNTLNYVYDGATWDFLRGSAADGALVNLGTNNDVTVTSGSIVADTELPAAAVLTDNFATPTAPAVGSFGMLYDGATWDMARGTAADGALVNLGTNNDVTFSPTSPTSPTNKYVTSAALAVAATANLDTGDLGAVKLTQVEVWASTAYKAAIYSISNGTPSTDPLAIGGGPSMQGWTWTPPHKDYAAVTSSGGVDGFRAAVTNLGTAAADVYATFHHEI